MNIRFLLIILISSIAINAADAPGGPYLFSCRNIETATEGSTGALYRVVRAECRRASGGQWQTSSIRLPMQSVVTLKNNDGQLAIDTQLK